MVETSLLIAIIGIGGTLLASAIGAYVTLKSTVIQEKHRNNRTVANHYMEEKYNRLLELYKINDALAGELATFIINSHQGNRQDALFEDDFYKYRKQVDKLFELDRECSLFLSKEQSNVVTRCGKLYVAILESMERGDTGYEIDWDEFENHENLHLYDIEIGPFREPARLVSEMIDNELNRPIEETYEGEISLW